MSGLGAFLAMGGYAQYVWPAYAVALLVLGGLTIWSISGYRRVLRQLAALQRSAPAARRP